MLWKGFRFGMLLQLAIGPICVFVLNTALGQGYVAAQMAVLGTVVTDGSEILLAIVGLGVALDRNIAAKRGMKYFGICILTICGLSSLLGAFEVSLLPTLHIPFVSGNPFVQAILLALSNPLTVIFWAGIFSAKIMEEHMQGSDLHFFALGCVLATFSFLTMVAVLGSLFNASIPPLVMKLTNIGVGILMLFFAYKNTKIKV